MQMSEHGRGLLTQWEGKINHVYDDSVGIPTIGVGHALTQAERSSGMLAINGSTVPYADGLSDDQVDALLASDLSRFENALNDSITVDVSENQFDALCSLCFNIGVAGFKSSSALRDLNSGNTDAVPDDIRKWNKAGGAVSQGLVHRRENEVRLWLGEI